MNSGEIQSLPPTPPNFTKLTKNLFAWTNKGRGWGGRFGERRTTTAKVPSSLEQWRCLFIFLLLISYAEKLTAISVAELTSIALDSTRLA